MMKGIRRIVQWDLADSTSHNMSKSSQISGLTNCETTQNLATTVLLEGKLRLTDSRISSFLTWKVNNVKKKWPKEYVKNTDSTYSGQQWGQKHTHGQWSDIKWLVMVSSKWNPFTKGQGNHRWCETKNVRSRGWWGMPWNAFLWIWHGYCNEYKLMSL